jgi:hypothetical protein
MTHYIRNLAVIKELKLYVECGISPVQAHQLINKRFNINAIYREVYTAYRDVKLSLNKLINL